MDPRDAQIKKLTLQLMDRDIQHQKKWQILNWILFTLNFTSGVYRLLHQEWASSIFSLAIAGLMVHAIFSADKLIKWIEDRKKRVQEEL